MLYTKTDNKPLYMSGSELLYIWHIYFTRPDDTNSMTFFSYRPKMRV